MNASDTASLSTRINTKLNASDTASLSTRINLKSNDNAVVHLTGTETIAGAKTYTNNILVNAAHNSSFITGNTSGNLRIITSDAATAGRGGTLGLGGNATTANINFAGISGTREDGSSDRGRYDIYTNGTFNTGSTQFISRLGINSDGAVTINPSSNNASYVTHFAVRATNGQSVNMFELRNSSNTATSYFNKFGGLVLLPGVSSALGSPLKFTNGVSTQTIREAGAFNYNGSNLLLSDANYDYVLSKTLTGSATLDFPSTSAQTSSELTITVTGAVDGDVVGVGVPNTSASANTSYSVRVSAANTVTVKFNNYSAAAVDPASGIFKVSVIK